MPRRELGEILLEADLINQGQLAEALNLQRTFGERLASVLVRQHILTEKFAVTYLGRQLGVPGVDFSRTEVDLGLLEVVPLEICDRHLVFPVKVEGTRLQLAMSDPMDHGLVSEIEFKTGVRLAPMIALEASSTIPFFIGDLTVLVLCIFFPGLSTWLPDLLITDVFK